MKKRLIISILTTLVSLTISLRAYAMESQQYQIQSEEITTESPSSQGSVSSGVALTPIDQATFNKNGFVISASPSLFSFSLEDTTVNFGSLPLNKPVVTSEGIHVSSPYGFSFSILESRPLTSLSGSTLPGTKCDSGCSPKHASQWTNNQRYGVGYNVQGEGVAEDFLDQTYFRAISNSNYELFFKNLSGRLKSDAQLSFKLNASPGNTDNYATTVTIQALPAY